MEEKRTVAGVSPLKENEKKRPPLMGGVRLEKSVTVNRPPETCYRYWRNFKNLENIMNHVESVKILDERRSHWMVTAPADTTAEWDAEIIEDIPNERISWRSIEGSQIDTAGSVQFSAAGSNQTTVKVVLSYNPPLGALGEALSHLFGESPDQELTEDLQRFKSVMEKGG